MNDVTPPGTLPLTRVGVAAPTFAFLHCFGTSRQEWRSVASRLAPAFGSVALDLPGFGDAAEVPGYDVRSMVASAVRTLGAMLAPPGGWVLVGHSMSGKIAAAIAAEQSLPLAGLVLIAASPPEPEPMHEADRQRMLAYEMNAACAADFFDRNTARPLTGERRDRAIAEFCRIHPAAWRAWLTAGSKEDWSTRVGTLALPALVITGAQDGLLNLAGQRRTTLKHLENARTIDLANCGHLPTLECPDELAFHLAEFGRSPHCRSS